MNWEIIKRVLKQITIPAIIAGIFTFYDGYSDPNGLTISGSMKVFFPALFFIMYFYGQYKRVEKQTEDKASFEGINFELSTLKNMVEGLTANIESSPLQIAPSLDSAHSLMTDSIALKDSGSNVAALLQAGLAFELSVRNFASKVMKHDEYANMNLLDVIRKIEKYLNPNIVGEFHALRQIRNRITHLHEDELSDLPDVEKTLNGYKWAIITLDEQAKDLPF